jgi:hypothetical protein
MTEPDESTTLTDDDIVTTPLGTSLNASSDDSGDTGDDSGDTGDDSGDTGDDSGDTGDVGDTGDAGDTGDDAA